MSLYQTIESYWSSKHPVLRSACCTTARSSGSRCAVSSPGATAASAATQPSSSTAAALQLELALDKRDGRSKRDVLVVGAAALPVLAAARVQAALAQHQAVWNAEQ